MIFATFSHLVYNYVFLLSVMKQVIVLSDAVYCANCQFNISCIWWLVGLSLNWYALLWLQSKDMLILRRALLFHLRTNNGLTIFHAQFVKKSLTELTAALYPLFVGIQFAGAA